MKNEYKIYEISCIHIWEIDWIEMEYKEIKCVLIL